ncbi:MAG: autotransporter-associated beta strand repeat-containing protein [bacterium]
MRIQNRFVMGMIVGAAVLAAGTSQAQFCWTNVASGVQVWNTPGNWTNGAPSQYGSVSSILKFNVAGTYTSSNNWSGIFTNNGMIFGAGTVTLAGGTNAFMNNGAVMPVVTNYGATVTINNPLVLATNTTFAGANDITVNGDMSGLGSLTKTNAGTLTLSGSNTYSGATTVNGGTLKAGSSTAIPGLSALTVTAGTFDLNGYSVTVSNLAPGSASGIITNSGSGSGTNTLTVTPVNWSGSTRVLSLITEGPSQPVALVFQGTNSLMNYPLGNVNNNFSGGMTLRSSTAGGVGIRFYVDQASYSGSPGAITKGQWGRGPITIGTSATDRAQLYLYLSLTLANDIIVNTSAGSGEVGFPGAFRSNGNGIYTLAGMITVNLASAYFIGGGQVILSNKVTGPSGMTLVSSGVVTLSNVDGSNDYQADTTITAGTLQLGANDQIPNGSGKGNVSLAGILDLNGHSDTINGLSGAGVVSNGVAGSASLTVGDGDATSTFSGTLKNTAGTLSLTKIGNGSLTLSGANTYNGATWVNAGKFVGVTGGSCSNSAILVADGATNSVSAVMGGAWSCASLTCTGGTTTLDFDFGSLQDTVAPLNVISGLSVTGTVNVVVRNGDWPATGTYPLVKYGSNVVGPGSFVLTPPPGVSATLNNNTGLKQLELVVTAVPSYTSQPTSVWTNKANGAWSTAANWTNSVPDGSDVVADFSKVNINAGLYVNVDSVRTIGTLVYNNSYAQNLTVSNSPVTLATTYGVPAIIVSNQTVTISSALQGTQGFIKSGSGTLTLVGNNKTYTGPTIIKAGTLWAGAANADLGLSTGTTVYLGDSSGGNDVTMRFSAVTTTYGNNFVVQSGNTGAALINGGDGNITLNGTITLGTANSNGHSLNINANNGIGTGGRTTTISGIIQDPLGMTPGTAGTVYITGGIDLPNQDPVAFNAANTYTGDTRIQTVAAPTAKPTNQGLRLGSVNALQNSTLDMNALDTGSICFNGNNTFVLGGLKGTRNISLGYGSTASGTGAAGTVTLSVGNNNQNTIYSGQLNNVDGTHLGALTKIGIGMLTLGGANTYSGVTTISGGFISVSNNLAMSTNLVTLSGGGIAGAGGMWAITNVINMASSATFDITGSLALMGPVTNSGTLTKIGGGTLILSAANTYRGGTTVNNGSLAVNGTITGIVTVVGGTLGGTGVVAGTVTNFATIGAIDTSTIGRLTVSNLVMKLNSSYAWNYTTSGNTDVYVNGNLSLPTVVTVNVTKVSGQMPKPGVLFTGFTNNLSASDLSGWVITGTTTKTRAKVVENQVVLQTLQGTLVTFQ